MPTPSTSSRGSGKIVLPPQRKTISFKGENYQPGRLRKNRFTVPGNDEAHRYQRARIRGVILKVLWYNISAMRLRLHTRYQNSAGQRIRIILNLKGLDYEYVPIPSPSSPDYDAINPQGLMPALEIDGRVVAQSMAIAELLEELFPNPSIFPSDPVLRAEVRAFSHLISSDLHPLNNNRVRRYLSDVMGQEQPAVWAWYQHWIAKAFGSLEAQLKRRAVPFPFCFDEKPTLADTCLVPQIDNARRFECDLAQYPLLTAVDAACRTLEAFARAAPEGQPDFPGPGDT